MSVKNQEGLLNMMKWTSRQALTLGLGAVITIMSMDALAVMTPLDSDQLSSVTGAAVSTGVQISLSAQINGTMTPGATPKWTPSAGCVGATGLPGANAQFCRFGLVENNNYNWVLLKDFNGFIDIPQLIVFGSSTNTVAFPSGQSVIGFQINMPAAGQNGLDQNGNLSQININNLSATYAVAVNGASVATAGSTTLLAGCYSNSGGALAVSGSCTSGSYNGSNLQALYNQNTYYDMTTFQNGNAAAANYSVVDAGKETGILAIRMTGNLNVGGTIYAFAK